MELIETPTFTRQIIEMVGDEDYARFQGQLAANPALGDRIPGGGGIRKIRMPLGDGGKRGGARVIY